MFSGIISTKSKILDINNGIFTVENNIKGEIKVGESFAHDGACMTIESFDNKKYSFFVMEESFKKTNFGEKKSGDFFNVEESLRLGDKIDGHFVTGHIDSTGKVIDIEIKDDDSKIIKIKYNPKFKNNLIEKGSIAVNGVSLTVINLDNENFSISLIPLTQELTNLGNLKISDTVNLEFDMLGKYIIRSSPNLS